MDIKTFKDGISVIDTDEIDARRIYSSEKVNTIQINLKPGAYVDRHTTEEDVLFYALEGSAELYIGSERGDFSKGMYARCPGGVVKGLLNSSSDIFKVLVIKMAD